MSLFLSFIFVLVLWERETIMTHRQSWKAITLNIIPYLGV